MTAVNGDTLEATERLLEQNLAEDRDEPGAEEIGVPNGRQHKDIMSDW